MDDEKASDALEQKTSLPAWVAGALLLAGGAGSGLVIQISQQGGSEADDNLVEIQRLVRNIAAIDPRPDPWTGTQAREQAAHEARALAAVAAQCAKDTQRIEARVAEINRRHERLSESVRRHHEESGIWKGRINTNSSRIDDIEKK